MFDGMPEASSESANHVDAANEMCAQSSDEPEHSKLSLRDVWERLDETHLSGEHNHRVYEALSVACGYETLSMHPNPYQALACGPFVPRLMQLGLGRMFVYPTPLDFIEPDIVAIWEWLACEPDLHPLVRARLGDLLVARHADCAQRMASVAVVSYVRVAADETIAGTDRAVAIERVRNLTKSMDIGDLIDAVNGV